MTARIEIVALSLAACAAPATTPVSPPPPAEPILGYRTPAGEPLTYQYVDSGGFTMNMSGMGTVDVEIVSRITAELDFAPSGDAVQVVVRITDLSGRFSNSMGPTLTVDNQHRPGPATVAVDRTGDVSIVEQPVFPEALTQVLTPQGLYRSFFIELPGVSVTRGATWTDTVRINEAPQGLTAGTVSIVRSTWARDTVVDGRTLAVITSDMDNSIELSGVSQGVEIRQSLRGTSRGVSLWDALAAVLVEQREEGQATGTTDLPGMNITGIPVTARSQTWLRLQR